MSEIICEESFCDKLNEMLNTGLYDDVKVIDLEVSHDLLRRIGEFSRYYTGNYEFCCRIFRFRSTSKIKGQEIKVI